MARGEIRVKQLRTRLSAYLRQVEAGETITITRNGKPIGRIVPVAWSTATRLETLRQAGLIAWNGEGLSPVAPVARAQGDHTVAELLLEDRE